MRLCADRAARAPALEMMRHLHAPRQRGGQVRPVRAHRVASMIFFSSNGELVPPTVSICQLYDWSNALASI
eukprot:594286-Prymnesium_polylepis.1